MQIAELFNFAISHLNNNEKKVTTKLLHVVAGKGIRGHLVHWYRIASLRMDSHISPRSFLFGWFVRFVKHPVLKAPHYNIVIHSVYGRTENLYFKMRSLR